MIRVFLVDDHELVRAGLERLMSETPDIRIEATAGSCAEAAGRFAAAAFPYDVVLVDVSLPDGDGLSLLRTLRGRKGGGPPALVLSIHDEAQYALRALRKGAAGYFAKDGAFEALAQAIRVVASGGRYLTAEVAERLASEVAGRPAGATEAALSGRELDVMGRVAAGLRSKDIAAEMAIDVRTVATYKARIRRKLGLSGTADIVRYALERGIGTKR